MRFTRRKLLWTAGLGLAAGAGGYKLLRGFEDDAERNLASLPARLRRAALDVHVHAIGTGAGGTGCSMSAKMRGSVPVRAGLWSYGLSLNDPQLDRNYVAYLLERVRSAGFLRQVVLLANDAFYTPEGRRDMERTPFYVPNEYPARLAREHPEFLFGASVHPYRPDALEELDRCAAAGAVLVKWLPNSQGIEMTDSACRAFYRRMAAHRMPLLAHVGDEQAVFIAGQHYGDPQGLAAPLEEGLTVIAAHFASLGDAKGQSHFDRLAAMLPRWPNLYADTSGLTLVTRWRALLRLAGRSGLHQRLVHGSDFPLPPAATMFFGRMPLRRWWDAWKRENPLRRDFEIKQALGLPEEILTRGWEVLAPRLAGSAGAA